jgi:hypothetical protein
VIENCESGTPALVESGRKASEWAISKQKAIPLGWDGFAWHNPIRFCDF